MQEMIKVQTTGHHYGGLEFFGPEDSAINVARDMRSIIDSSGLDIPNYMRDFLNAIEAALQEVGRMDDNFNVVSDVDRNATVMAANNLSDEAWDVMGPHYRRQLYLAHFSKD